MGIRE